ncbi:L-glutaminase [Natronincola peptidivorans]|uniref:Glutaminase n=1 Tax=Natronincola peptidivorans TaxID=426128 RepID=A0A1I0A2V5_9FIRM|nr:glutaminase A [Natronincola peptidivorans]SES88023.1 L-glutaminase [Natronincola peptidivorans]
MKEEIKKHLENAITSYHHYYASGKLAAYIPALLEANPKAIGACILDKEGHWYCAGDYEKRFTIQSISKIVTLALAIMDNGEESVFSKMGYEPTGDSFNSLVRMEINRVPKPYNPMINAGAIVVTSMIKGEDNNEKLERIIDFFKRLTSNEELSIDGKVYLSEKETGHRNRALAYYMKEVGILSLDVEDVLDLYFQQCSILVNCQDLAKIAMVFANDGVDINTGEELVPKYIARKIRTIMVTCGMYDASGSFAVRVGLPAKSGVGGGIIALSPKKLGIGLYGPALDDKGNSIVGMKVLEELSRKLDLSIF